MTCELRRCRSLAYWQAVRLDPDARCQTLVLVVLTVISPKFVKTDKPRTSKKSILFNVVPIEYPFIVDNTSLASFNFKKGRVLLFAWEPGAISKLDCYRASFDFG